jgi:Icc-related predicted phosphoesterase
VTEAGKGRKEAPVAPRGATAVLPAKRPAPETPKAGRIRIAGMADLHVHKAHHGLYRQMFTHVAERADVLCLGGDLTNLGLPEEAENLAADLSVLKIPVLAVLGNHDYQSGKAGQVRDILRRASVTFLDEDETVELGRVGFAGVKGFGGGFASHMLGSFGEDETKRFVTEAVNEALALENALARVMAAPGIDRGVVLLHYSPIAETVKGEPLEIYPFLGCSRLAETIDRFNVAVVFHGHAHHGSPHGKTPRGVPVHNCSLELMRARDGGKGDGFVVVEV